MNTPSRFVDKIRNHKLADDEITSFLRDAGLKVDSGIPFCFLLL